MQNQVGQRPTEDKTRNGDAGRNEISAEGPFGQIQCIEPAGQIGHDEKGQGSRPNIGSSRVVGDEVGDPAADEPVFDVLMLRAVHTLSLEGDEKPPCDDSFERNVKCIRQERWRPTNMMGTYGTHSRFRRNSRRWS